MVKKIKRMMACILACILVLNLGGPIGNVLAESPVESGTITLHGNSSNGEAEAASRIWLVLETSNKPSVWSRMTAVTGEGYVKVNGEDVDSALYGGGEEPAYLLQLSAAVEQDDVLTISGKFTTADGSYVINMQETSFQYLGGKWAIYQGHTTVESGDVTLHGNSSNGEAEAASRIWLVLETSNKPSVWSRMTAVTGEGYVKVNGEDVDSALYGGGEEPAYLLQLSAAVEQDDVLTISGKFTTADGSYVINMQETSFQYLGGKWAIYQGVTRVDSGEVTLHGNSSAGGADASCIWLVLEATEKPATWSRMTAVTGEGYVKVNGEDVDSALYGGGSEPVFLLQLSTAVEKEDILTVSGEFTTADGSYVINMQETTFKYDASDNGYWKIMMAADLADYTEVTVQSVDDVSGYNQGAQRYDFYLKLDQTIGDTTSTITGMQCTINDNETKPLTAMMTPHDGETMLLAIWMEEATANTKITVSGRGLLSENQQKGVALTNPISFYVNQYGWATDDYVKPTAYADTSINEFFADATSYKNETDGWHFYLGFSKKNSLIQQDTTLVGFQYSIDGAAAKDLKAWYSSYQDGSLFFVMPELPKTLTKDTMLTISGQAKTTDGKNGITLTSSVTLYGNAYGWSLEGYPKPTQYFDVLGKALNNASGWHVYDNDSRWDFYLELQGDTSKIPDNALLSGFEYSINNGEKKPLGECFWSPHAGGTLLFVVRELPQKELTEKMTLTISGKAKTTDGSYGLQLSEPITLYGNQYAWSIDAYVKPTVYMETAISEFYGDASNYKNETEGWHFYLGFSKKNSSIQQDISLTGFKYSINGSAEKDLVAWYSSYQDGSLFFIMPELPKTLTKNTTLTISGKAKTTDGKNGITLTSPVTLYGNEYGWSLKGYPKPTQYTNVSAETLNGATGWHVYDNDSRWDFYLELQGDTSKIPDHALLSGFEYSINNGEKKSLGECFWSPHAGGTLLFVVRELPKEKLTNETTITLSGKAKTTDGSYGIELEKPVTLYGNQYGWSLTGYPKEPVYTTIQVTGVNGATGYRPAYDRWDIYLNVDKMLPGADDSSFEGLEIEVNGKTYKTVVSHASFQDTLFIAIEGKDLPKSSANGTKIVLKAGKAIQGGQGIGIELKQDVVLYKFYDSVTLKKPTTNTEYKELTIGSMARATKFNKEAQIWQLFLQPTQSIPGDDGTVFYELKAILNGKEVLLKATKEGKILYISMGTDILPENAKTGTLTIKAGTKAVGGAGEIGITFAEDFNIYLFNGVWSEEQFDEVIETELYCTRLHNVTHNVGATLWGFYFKTNAEFPGISWYNKFDKFQVELNGKMITVELNKGESSNGRVIYFGVDEAVVGTFKEGSILRIKAGSVAEDGGYKNTFTKDFALIYTKGMWIEYRETDKVAPAAQNLWDIARFDHGYIPKSDDGTVLASADDKYNQITSTEKLMDHTVSFTGKKFNDDATGASFYIVLRGNAISENEPISRGLLYGYVITFEGYELTEENTPDSPELWGTRTGFINVWKNGENAALSDQYLIGTHHNMNNDPFFKYDETYHYEVSIYNITETAVCIEFKVNGEVVYKCYDDATSDPMDPAVNSGTFGLYPMSPTVIGGETVELETVLAEQTECVVGDKVGVAVTYPSILAGAEFTVDKKGATIQDGEFVATKVGTYTITATYKGRQLEPVTITVKEKPVEDALEEQTGNMTVVVAITAVSLLIVAGIVAMVLIKRKKKNQSL